MLKISLLGLLAGLSASLSSGCSSDNPVVVIRGGDGLLGIEVK